MDLYAACFGIKADHSVVAPVLDLEGVQRRELLAQLVQDIEECLIYGRRVIVVPLAQFFSSKGIMRISVKVNLTISIRTGSSSRTLTCFQSASVISGKQ